MGKLAWIKRFGPQLLGDASKPDEIFFWMDLFSIPQDRSTEKGKACFLAALRSLPYYAFITGRFLPIVHDLPAIDKYLERGWCATECLCALTPKVTQSGAWRLGPMPSALKFRFF